MTDDQASQLLAEIKKANIFLGLISEAVVRLSRPLVAVRTEEVVAGEPPMPMVSARAPNRGSANG